MILLGALAGATSSPDRGARGQAQWLFDYFSAGEIAL
jgi:hypothetical protein